MHPGRISDVKSFLLAALGLALILPGCTPAAWSSSPLTTAAVCGNGFCESGENHVSCPVDCPVAGFSGKIQTTADQFQRERGYCRDGRLSKVGPISRRSGGSCGGPAHIERDQRLHDRPGPDHTGADPSELYVARRNRYYFREQERRNIRFGGEQSIQVLRDVILFASGSLADIDGKFLPAFTNVTPLTGEVGVYGFSRCRHRCSKRFQPVRRPVEQRAIFCRQGKPHRRYAGHPGSRLHR